MITVHPTPIGGPQAAPEAPAGAAGSCVPGHGSENLALGKYAGGSFRGEWTPVQTEWARHLVANGLSGREIALMMGEKKSTVDGRLRRAGLSCRSAEPISDRRRAGEAVLIRLWPTHTPAEEVHALWCAARQDRGTIKTMRGQAQQLRLFRPPGIYRASGALGRASGAARAAAKRAEKVPLVQAGLDAGMSMQGAAKAAGVGEATLRRMRLDGMLTVPQKARKQPPPRKRYGPERALPPRALKPIIQAQTVEEYLAQGGQITRCPTAVAAATTATIDRADAEAMRAYHDRQAAELAKHGGNAWKLARMRAMKHRGARV